MLASLRWLSELSGLDLSAEQLAVDLTSVGLEVEGVREVGRGLDAIVLATVVAVRPHPSRDQLQLVTVDDGQGEQEIVCGATNVPAPGGRVVLARLGARLPAGLEIAERKLGGVVSRGMLCGEVELEVGEDDSGLLIIEESVSAPNGTPIADALQLADTVLEIGLTPNRPDCLGHLGLARDLCALRGVPLPELKLPDGVRFVAGAPLQGPEVFSLQQESGDARALPRAEGIPAFEVAIQEPERCPRYTAALVRGVKVAPSPFWLRYRLHCVGQRSINNLVDATNLILLGLGHPVHGFDLKRIRDNRIEVRAAKEGEVLRTLDEVDRKLAAEDLVICDGRGPVALAGIMGGENSEVHAATETALVECAYFAPSRVRRTSKRLGLHTEASHRFERGMDPVGLRTVLLHTAAWVAVLGGGEVVDEALDARSKPHQPPTIKLRLPRLHALLSVELGKDRVEAILTALGCEVSEAAGGIWMVVPPGHRPDLLREVDLIEEVARIEGYDSIPERLPTIRPSTEAPAGRVQFLRQVREAAAANGLMEAVNFAFLSPDDLKAARLPTAACQLLNPMSEERSVLRTGLLAGLAGNLKLAQRKQVSRFAQFELSRIFLQGEQGDALPHERYELGICLWGERGGWFKEGEAMDFFDLKGVLNRILTQLGCNQLQTDADDSVVASAPYLHPRRCAQLSIGSFPIGVLGELHPEVVDALDLIGRPVYAVIDTEKMDAVLSRLGRPQGRPLPRFPAVVRDLAVSVPTEIQAQQVAQSILSAGGDLVEGVKLFDVYTGPPVPENHKSLAFHVVYRDQNATLTDKVVDKAHAKVVQSAERTFAASVRK